MAPTNKRRRYRTPPSFGKPVFVAADGEMKLSLPGRGFKKLPDMATLRMEGAAEATLLFKMSRRPDGQEIGFYDAPERGERLVMYSYPGRVYQWTATVKEVYRYKLGGARGMHNTGMVVVRDLRVEGKVGVDVNSEWDNS